MDDKLRMKLSDLGSPELLADCIISHFGMEPPIPLLRIAEAVGIVEIIGKAADSFEGVLVTTSAKSEGSIIYNEASWPERRRFTIAHELGHFLMPLHGANAQCVKADMSEMTTKEASRRREAEANRFAAALLMPNNLFLRDMRKLGKPEVAHILKLANDYEVSKEAIALRYTRLCDDPCAVILSKHDRVVRIYKTHDFPLVDLSKAQPLPSRCISADAKSEPGKISDWSEVTPEIWLGDAHRLRKAVLYEHYLHQSNGYRMTMLTIDGELTDDDEFDEEAELEESWTPRFRR